MRLNARFASVVAASCVGAAALGHPERIKGILVAGLPGSALMCHMVYWRMRVVYREVRLDAERTLAASSRPRHTAERLRESHCRSLGVPVPDRPVFLLWDYYTARKAGSPQEARHDGDDAGSRAHDPGRGAVVDRTQTANGAYAVGVTRMKPAFSRAGRGALALIRWGLMTLGAVTLAALVAGAVKVYLEPGPYDHAAPFPSEADRKALSDERTAQARKIVQDRYDREEGHAKD